MTLKLKPLLFAMALSLSGIGSAAAAPAEILVERKNDITLGRPGAPVTLIAYLEYYQLYPQTVGPLLRTVRRTWPDEVRIIVRDFPMAYHAGAALTAQAAHGVFEQAGAESFLQFAETVTPYRGSRDASYLAAIAAKVGAGPAERFETQLIQNRWQERLDQSRRDVELARLSGSPFWFVNGTPILGVKTQQVLDAIQHAVKSGGGSGVAPAASAPGAGPPVLRPGQGIGPFSLGQSLAAFKRLGLRHSPLHRPGHPLSLRRGAGREGLKSEKRAC